MSQVYSKLKIFHFPEKLASLGPDTPEILPPLQIRIKPTNICNHNCSYCAYHVDYLQLGQDMVYRDTIPRDKMMEILDDVCEMGVKSVTFSGGGEPFVYPHLLESVKRLIDGGVQFASLTNGSRLTGEIAELFAFQGTWLRVSIDGWDDASYAQFRGVKEGEFTKVMSHMEAFLRLGGNCRLSVIVNVDRTNAGHVYEHIQRLAGIGVKVVKIAPVIYSNDGGECFEYHEATMGLVAEQVARGRQDFPGIEIYSSYEDQTTTFAKDYHWCPFIQIRPVIGADLNVYACHDKAYNLDTGVLFSIKDRRFKDAWFSDKNQFFGVDPSRVCNHHCMVDENNKMILDYLDVDVRHLGFV